MHRQWEQTSTVKSGGRVEVMVPDLSEGDVVKVSVSAQDPQPCAKRPLGVLRGKVRIEPDFDAPLAEFDQDR